MAGALDRLPADSVSFGPFCLFPNARVLRRGGIPVTLGSRALDILIALVERAGEVVNQRELMSRAWRGLVVESGNLRVQMTYLRRSLGEGEQGARYIANVPGQGYCFVAPVRRPDPNEWHGRSTHLCSRNRRFTQDQHPKAFHDREGDFGSGVT